VQFNIHNGNGRRDYPAWNTRVRILAVDAEGNAVEGEWDFNGEMFERSPRFIRGGHTYRLRPVRPLAVLAALAFRLKLLPALLSAEEVQSEWGQELIVPLWAQVSRRFDNLASPLAEKDRSVKPGPVHGWSFTELQVLCRECGVASGSTSRISQDQRSPGKCKAAAPRLLPLMQPQKSQPPDRHFSRPSPLARLPTLNKEHHEASTRREVTLRHLRATPQSRHRSRPASPGPVLCQRMQ
jgi:hypothetical protein